MCMLHHLEISTCGNGNNWQLFYRGYIKGGEGIWGAGAPQKPTELKEAKLNGSFSFSMNQIFFF